MNYLWAGMMLVAIIYGAVHGTIPEVTQAALDSSKEAVTLCITMLGILSFWMGLMQIASASGLIEKMTRWIRPVLCWLFPRIPKGHPAMEQIAVNCIANERIIIGLNKELLTKRLYLVPFFNQNLFCFLRLWTGIERQAAVMPERDRILSNPHGSALCSPVSGTSA